METSSTSLASDLTFAHSIRWLLEFYLNQRHPTVESAPALNPACNKAHVISNGALLPTVARSKWNKQPLCHPWCCVTLHLRTSLTDTVQLTRHLRKHLFLRKHVGIFFKECLVSPRGDGGGDECRTGGTVHTHHCARALSCCGVGGTGLHASEPHRTVIRVATPPGQTLHQKAVLVVEQMAVLGRTILLKNVG